jgi:hypothetical protein
MFFRRHVQKSVPPTNHNTSPSIIIPPIAFDTINLTDDDNELPTTPTPLSSNEKTINNFPLIIPTSTNEHLLEKHPGLLRLFDSTVCTVAIVISYLFSTKEPVVQQFLGRKLFDYPYDEIDFYLPQLLNMYIHIQSISTVIHDYITTRLFFFCLFLFISISFFFLLCFRCSQSVDFSLQCTWLLDAYTADQMKTSKKQNDAVRLLFDILYEKYKPQICYTPTIPNNLTNNHHHFTLDEVENENFIIDEDNHNEKTSSQENLTSQINKKRGHQKSRSDASGIL